VSKRRPQASDSRGACLQGPRARAAWVQAILGIIKAVPALERLFEAVADAHREAKAKERLEEKLDFIDRALLEHHAAD